MSVTDLIFILLLVLISFSCFIFLSYTSVLIVASKNKQEYHGREEV